MIKKWLETGNDREQTDSIQRETGELLSYFTEENLEKCHQVIGKAYGREKRSYERNFGENIRQLSAKVRRGEYRPHESWEYEEGEFYSYEDKLVENIIVKILLTVYTTIFYRLKTEQYQEQDRGILYHDKKNTDNYMSYIIRAYINTEGYHPGSGEMLEILQDTIKDKKFLALIGEFLDVEAKEDNELLRRNQGEDPLAVVCYKLYFNYAIDQWFQESITHACKGRVCMIHHADSIVCGFQNSWEAEIFYRTLQEKYSASGLELSLEKRLRG